MRLFPLLCAYVLSSVTQHVAAEDSSTLPSIQISNESLNTSHLPSISEFEVIVVAMASLATSTLDSGVDHKGSTTYDCTTYTTVITHNYTRPRTSTMTATHTELSGSVSTTGGLGFGVTSVSDSVPSNTGSVSSSITTGTDTENTSTETGSETNGSSLPESSDFSIPESDILSPNPLASLTPLAPTTTTTNLDGHGSQVTTSSIPGIATIYPVPGAVLATTTDELGNIITISNNAPPTTASPIPGFITTTDAEGNVITHSNCIDLTSCLLWQTLSSDVISSSMSAISSEFRKLLRTFSSWEVKPEPPLQTSIINGVEEVEHRIEDLDGKLGGKSFPKCPKSKRGLFDDLFNIAADVIETIISGLNCITRNTENLKKEIKDKDVEAVKDLLPRLISLDDKPTSTTTSAITYSTLSSITPSSCTSATAYQVTVFCEPSLVTTADAETETTTCSPMTTGSCGGGLCPAGDGGWVTINPIDCAKVPTVTVGGLPLQPVDPITLLAGRLTTEGKWLSHKNGDTAGKWYMFTNEKTAAGVTGLFGCTSIVIVSKHGVYLSHIYEDPVFVKKTKLGFLRPTIDKHPHRDDREPGSTTLYLQPKIFTVTPFKHGGIGPLMYAKQVEWLSDQLHSYLYPAGSEQYDQKPELIPYKIAPQYLAENPESLSGKIIMEATQLDHYEQSGDQLSAIGPCRLWVNGKETVTWEFSSQGSVNAVGHGLNVLRARDGHYAGICPVSTLSSTQTSTTFTTTTSITPSTSTSLTSASAAPATGAAALPSDPSLIGKPQCYEHSDSSPTIIDASTVQAFSDKCFDGTTIPAEKLSLGGPEDPSSISWTVDNYFAEIIRSTLRGSGTESAVSHGRI
ncbi:hypothetical protein BJX62DRAFT_238067 [Aspergillus germanicus]